MAPIKIKHVVSFTSQDSKNGVDNLCAAGDRSRPWLCSVQDRSGVLRVELQMERASAVGFIDVGNFGSAFIQVDVGRSSWSLEHPYVTLLPTATLMSPSDSRQGIGRQNVRMFKKADFLSPAAVESWDRLRVTCTQPFNKHSQFGLSFLRIRTTEDEAEDSSAQQEDIAAESLHTPEKMTSVMEWLASPGIQNTFFGQITRNGTPEGQRKAGSLSRAELMVKAAHSNRRSVSTSPCSSTSSTTPQRDDHVKTSPGGFTTSGDPEKTPQEQRRKSKARSRLQNSVTPLKRPRPTESTHPHNSSSPSESVRRCSVSSPDTQPPLSCPETTCPLCGESFSPEYLPFHASSCLESDPAALMGVVSSRHSSSVFGSGTGEHMVPCPLCSIPFPPDRIQQHASACGDSPGD